MAATAVMAASAAIRAAMRTDGATQSQGPKSAGSPSLGSGLMSNVGIQTRRVIRRNRSRRGRKRDGDKMNRWSAPGVVRDVEQQMGEYGVDWDEWGPIPRVAEGADWKPAQPKPPHPTLEARMKQRASGGTKSTRGGCPRRTQPGWSGTVKTTSRMVSMLVFLP
jgi:hypothetical protein